MNSGYLITEKSFTDRMNVLIYGDPGAGKTWLAGTAQDSPFMANVHFLNVDGGMMTLAGRGDISATDIRTVDELEEELFRISSGDEKYSGIRTVVIDNITELLTLTLENIAAKELSDRRRKNKNYSIDDVYLEDYGIAGRRISRILRGFRDLPIHVVYIAHRKDKMRKGTNVLEESKPNLTDKLCTSVMGYMDFVWYLYTSDEVMDENGNTETHRYLLTQPMNGFVAKTRGSKFADRIGPIVRDPDMSMLMQEYMDTDR